MEERTIGQRIAACRKELNLSQMGLGEKVGVTRQAISKWEAGAAIPEIDKLVALSRLFGVSVGWLLGVEEGSGSPQTQEYAEADEEEPEEEFTARERELIDALTRPRPLPRYQKIAMAVVAVCAALSLVLSGGALWTTTRFQEELKVTVQTAMEHFLPGISATANQLEKYSFTLFPHEDLTETAIDFRAVPMFYEEGMEAKLIVTLDGQEVAVQDCEWADNAFLCFLTLKAANGYEPRLVLTSTDGITTTSNLRDPVVTNLGSSMDFGLTSVGFSSCSLDAEQILTLQNIRFKIGLPAAWRDVEDKWTRCDLVAYIGGKEADRVDILNRSAYSKQLNFSDTAVDFTSGSQRFDLTGAKDGDRITLMLECEFYNGQTMQNTVQEWTLTGMKLVSE